MGPAGGGGRGAGSLPSLPPSRPALPCPPSPPLTWQSGGDIVIPRSHSAEHQAENLALWDAGGSCDSEVVPCGVTDAFAAAQASTSTSWTLPRSRASRRIGPRRTTLTASVSGVVGAKARGQLLLVASFLSPPSQPNLSFRVPTLQRGARNHAIVVKGREGEDSAREVDRLPQAPSGVCSSMTCLLTVVALPESWHPSC